MAALRFTFECGCAATYWAERDELKGGLSCCSLHEASGQSLPNVLKRCSMLLVRVGTVAGIDEAIEWSQTQERLTQR